MTAHSLQSKKRRGRKPWTYKPTENEREFRRILRRLRSRAHYSLIRRAHDANTAAEKAGYIKSKKGNALSIPTEQDSTPVSTRRGRRIVYNTLCCQDCGRPLANARGKTCNKCRKARKVKQ